MGHGALVNWQMAGRCDAQGQIPVVRRVAGGHSDAVDLHAGPTGQPCTEAERERIAGSLQAKAEGWMDRERLNAQFASVRDGAADLLEQLAGGATKASSGRGRSGGVVDAPGKKHRKPLPPDPGARMVDSQAAKLRTATTMVKTNRRRGRG